MIYAIQANDGAIKIGYSENPRKRLAQLQSAHPHPLTLVAVTAGSQETERKLHRELKEYRSGGGKEWYKPCEAIRNLIANIHIQGWK